MLAIYAIRLLQICFWFNAIIIRTKHLIKFVQLCVRLSTSIHESSSPACQLPFKLRQFSDRVLKIAKSVWAQLLAPRWSERINCDAMKTLRHVRAILRVETWANPTKDFVERFWHETTNSQTRSYFRAFNGIARTRSTLQSRLRREIMHNFEITITTFIPSSQQIFPSQLRLIKLKNEHAVLRFTIPCH